MPNPLYDRLFGRHAGRDDAFLHMSDGTSLSYDAFLALAGRFAGALAAADLAPGDRLAVQVEKSPAALALYAAAVQAGVVFLPLNTAYTGEEMAYFVKDSGAKLLICDPARQADLAPVAAETGGRIATLDAHGQGSFADDAAAIAMARRYLERAIEFATLFSEREVFREALRSLSEES